MALFAMLAVPSALAAKADGPKARLFAKYDQNKNGVIDGAEKDALRKDYAADKEGPLAQYDKDKDGKLSDEEIAAIKPPAGKGKGPKVKTEEAGKAEKSEKADKVKPEQKNKPVEKSAESASPAKP